MKVNLMKTVILLFILIFVYGGLLAQEESMPALKRQSITIEKHREPSAMQASAALVIDVDNREKEIENYQLTLESVNLEKSETRDYSIKASAEITNNEVLIEAKEKVKPLQFFEITLEPQFEPSKLKPTAVKAN